MTPGPTQCGLSRSLTNRQNTQPFTSLKRELALPSTWSWLPSLLSSTWLWKERIECIYSNSKFAKKKRDILSEKRESGMALKKREFTPESGSVDTYVMTYCTMQSSDGILPQLVVSEGGWNVFQRYVREVWSQIFDAYQMRQMHTLSRKRACLHHSTGKYISVVSCIFRRVQLFNSNMQHCFRPRETFC